ncbi:MAG: hypothetical protein M1817_001942 [Caeruleum heppii]|nr:MAG: hypothetical protein M1817_001942 [Caeruleum heppii]
MGDTAQHPSGPDNDGIKTPGDEEAWPLPELEQPVTTKKDIRSLQDDLGNDNGAIQKRHPLLSPATSNEPDQKRKGKRPLDRNLRPTCDSAEANPPPDVAERNPKRQRSSPPVRATEVASAPDQIQQGGLDLVSRWVDAQPWPGDEDLQGSAMNPLLNRKRSSSSRSKPSESSDSSWKEPKPPDARSRAYDRTLAEVSIHLDGGPKVTDSCRALCKTLLNSEQSFPPDTFFREDRFEKLCTRLRSENEAKVVRDISPLIVPSVEALCDYGADHLECFVDHANQQWSACIPVVIGPVPQPDYSAGCKDTAFTPEQLRKLAPFVKGWKGTPFLVTPWMYFPFLTQEVKCGNEGLNVADRQNAHSGSVAVKQVVNLYRAVGRQDELHRTILAFSVSNDNEAVRIYGHYPAIDGDRTSFHRHPIIKFDLTSEEGRQRWTAYRFTKNVYDIFSPIHLERLRTAIDLLPDLPSEPIAQQSDIATNVQPRRDPSVSIDASNDTSNDAALANATIQPSVKKPRTEANEALESTIDTSIDKSPDHAV